MGVKSLAHSRLFMLSLKSQCGALKTAAEAVPFAQASEVSFIMMVMTGMLITSLILMAGYSLAKPPKQSSSL